MSSSSFPYVKVNWTEIIHTRCLYNPFLKIPKNGDVTVSLVIFHSLTILKVSFFSLTSILNLLLKFKSITSSPIPNGKGEQFITGVLPGPSIHQKVLHHTEKCKMTTKLWKRGLYNNLFLYSFPNSSCQIAG